MTNYLERAIQIAQTKTRSAKLRQKVSVCPACRELGEPLHLVISASPNQPLDLEPPDEILPPVPDVPPRDVTHQPIGVAIHVSDPEGAHGLSAPILVEWTTITVAEWLNGSTLSLTINPPTFS